MSGTFLSIGGLFVRLSCSFQVIVNIQKDAVSAYCLLRVMSDYLATLYLIYKAPSVEEREFRYLLYYLDGFCERLKVIPKCVEKDAHITDEEFDKLNVQIHEAIDNAQQGKDRVKEMLDVHPYIKINHALFQKIVSKNNWKYKIFDARCTKMESYSWNEMYELIDERENVINFTSYLSQYVHGLCNSLLAKNTQDDFYAIRCIGASRVCKYLDLLKELFGKKECENSLIVEI